MTDTSMSDYLFKQTPITETFVKQAKRELEDEKPEIAAKLGEFFGKMGFSDSVMARWLDSETTPRDFLKEPVELEQMQELLSNMDAHITVLMGLFDDPDIEVQRMKLFSMFIMMMEMTKILDAGFKICLAGELMGLKE